MHFKIKSSLTGVTENLFAKRKWTGDAVEDENFCSICAWAMGPVSKLRQSLELCISNE